VLGGVSALINLKKIVRGAGKAYSAIIRKYLGKKAERGQEELAQEFVDGMKDDNNQQEQAK